jgi:hypothetical protein
MKQSNGERLSFSGESKIFPAKKFVVILYFLKDDAH